MRVDNEGAVPTAVVHEETAERLGWELGELLAISRAMSSERDIHKLLDLILERSRHITGADAGSVYVVETSDEKDPTVPSRRLLHFMLSQNDSIAIDFKQFKLPVDEKSIVGRAVLAARPLNIPDLSALSQPGQNPAGVQHNRSFDDKTGYRARSMLTVPMLSAHDEVMGVIQLINKKRHPARKLSVPKDFEDEVVPFDARSEQLALALASQAGICLENAILYEEIRKLFEGFVDASVTAIEARDPSTSGHSRRVATLSVALAEKVDAISDGPLRGVRFSREELRQIEYAGVLHDFGKVGVRENVLVKAKKLYDGQKSAIEQRFRYIHKAIEAEGLAAQLDIVKRHGPGAAERLLAVEGDSAAKVAALDEVLRFVTLTNEPTVLSQGAPERLADIAALEYVDFDGTRRPYLEPDELEALRIARGSLTESERQEIQSHVSHTISFLETIPWGRGFRNVPRIAGGHHEFLDGRGYPRGLKGDAIPVETRMLTISDIFDALTAADRPYKPAVPVPKALDILSSEVKQGRLDPVLFDVFVQAEVYRKLVVA